MPILSKKKLSADEIAEKAVRGEDVSAYFTNNFTVVRSIHRANLDPTQSPLRQPDERSARLSIGRKKRLVVKLLTK